MTSDWQVVSVLLHHHGYSLAHCLAFSRLLTNALDDMWNYAWAMLNKWAWFVFLDYTLFTPSRSPSIPTTWKWSHFHGEGPFDFIRKLRKRLLTIILTCKLECWFSSVHQSKVWYTLAKLQALLQIPKIYLLCSWASCSVGTRSSLLSRGCCWSGQKGLPLVGTPPQFLTGCSFMLPLRGVFKHTRL